MPKCLAPFRQLMLDPKGNVYPCCYHYGYKLGNLRDKNIRDIWNGPKVKKLREEFLSGEIKSCRGRMAGGCYKDFEHLSVSEQRSDEVNLLRLDIRLGGKCNLRCVMCDVWQQPNGIYDKTSFWHEGPNEIFPYLKEVDLLGGEPFVQEETYRLIDEILRVNQECKFSFITNGHYHFERRVKGALALLKIQRIQLSLDSLNPETYDKIRLGGRLDLPLKTLDGLVRLRSEKKFELKVSMCVLNVNWAEVPHFLDFCRKRDIVPELQFAHYDAGSGLSLKGEDNESKMKIYDWLLTKTPERDQHFLSPILVGLKKSK